MGGCATKLRQAFQADDKPEKPEPPVEVEEEKKSTADTEEQFKQRVKEIIREDEKENEIALVDEIQGCKQRPSLSLLFKQDEVNDWAESEKPKNETKGKQEPIVEAQEPEVTRPKEDQHEHHDQEQGKIKEEQLDASEQTKSEDVVASSAS